MIDSYEWENAGILGCRHFHFEFSVLGFKHAVPEMIALWKMHTDLWLWIILAYYFVATFISIDKIIGRIYPFLVSV